MRNLLLEFRRVSTQPQAYQSLRDVSFMIFEGEFASMIGADNSGEASILDILNGEQRCAQGDVLLCGARYAPKNINEAHRRGVYCINRVSSLLDEQSITENFFYNTDQLPLFSRVQDKRFHQETQALLQRYGLGFDAAAKVKIYSENVKCVLEMVKCVRLGARLIVLCNIMKSGSPEEYELFMGITRQLVRQGISVLLITSQCGEYLRQASRVMVLSRRGRLVRTLYPEDFSAEWLETYLTNSILNVVPKIHPVPPGRRILRAEGVGAAGNRVAYALHEGEIIGLLLGNSRRYGRYTPPNNGLAALRGKIWIDEERVHIRDEWDAMRHGIGLIPEDPSRVYYPDLSIEDNVLMPFLPAASNGIGIIRDGHVRALRQDMEVWLRRMEGEFGFSASEACIYSVIVRSLMYPYRIIVLSMPRWINDIRKTSMLFWMMDILIHKGSSIIVVSSNKEELRGMCTSIYEAI